MLRVQKRTHEAKPFEKILNLLILHVVLALTIIVHAHTYPILKVLRDITITASFFKSAVSWNYIFCITNYFAGKSIRADYFIIDKNKWVATIIVVWMNSLRATGIFNYNIFRKTIMVWMKRKIVAVTLQLNLIHILISSMKRFSFWK